MRRYESEPDKGGTWKVVRTTDGTVVEFEGASLERLKYEEADRLVTVLTLVTELIYGLKPEAERRGPLQ